MPVCLAASNTDALQFFEDVAEVIENVARQQRLLALVAVEDCDLRGAAAYPCTDSRGIVRREALPQQTGANSGENVAHAAGSHSRVARRVVAQRPTVFSDDGATAFE